MAVASRVQRIIALDLIRGYFLLVILINHLDRVPGAFDVFTGRGLLWASAAEGFFLISGLLVGLVRGREVKEGRLRTATAKMWRRAFYLYCWSLGLTLLFTVIGNLYLHNPGLKPGITLPDTVGWGSFLWDLLTLHYTYGWADFLRYYAFYMLFAPVCLWLLSRREWPLALATTGLLFAFKSDTQYLIWQLYFFGGTIIGYHWLDITARMEGFGARKLNIMRKVIYGLALITLIADAASIVLRRATNRSALFGNGVLSIVHQALAKLHGLDTSWFNRFADTAHPYGYGRVFISLLWFSALYLLVRRYEETINRWIGWLLLPVGCNPLLVYGFDAVLIFAADLIFSHGDNLWINTLLSGVAIALTRLIANYKPLLSRRQNLATV